MRQVSIAVPLVIAWLAAAPSWAQPIPDGPEFLVNTYTTGFQREPSIAMDGAGNFVVVWTSYSQDGDRGGVFGQLFDSTGTDQGGEFPVNTFTTDDQRRADVAMHSSGNFVVVWQGEGDQDGSAYGVFGQRFDSMGIPQGGEFQVNTLTMNSQGSPSVAMDTYGNFVVVWNGPAEIFGQRFDSTGAMLKTEFVVNTFTPYGQSRPAVAVDASGNFVVAWRSYLQDGSDFGIFAQRFDNAGKLQGGEFPVNTFTMNNQRSPAVSMEGSGNFVVTWQSNEQDGDRNGIFAQRFDHIGAPLGGEFPVNAITTDGQTGSVVSMDGSGNFVIAWTDYYPQDGSDAGVFAERFDSSGSSAGGDFQVNTHTYFYQRLPSVSMDGSGEFVVAWHSYIQDGSGTGIFAQRFLPCSSPIGFVGNLLVDTAHDGGDLVFTWPNTTNADDYVVLEDSSARGLFNTTTGTAASGVTGLTIPTPPETLIYYLAAGRNAACGVGPKR